MKGEDFSMSKKYLIFYHHWHHVMIMMSHKSTNAFDSRNLNPWSDVGKAKQARHSTNSTLIRTLRY